MKWTVLSLDDFDSLRGRLDSGGLAGSDCSLVNVFLLQKKYDIRTAIEQGFLFRYYTGAENRTGYGWPLPLGPGGEGRLEQALRLIVADAAEQGRRVKFCLLDARQKDAVAACLSRCFPDVALEWDTCRDDSDYLYERAKLADLPGKAYHKKKNHVSRFLRTYGGAWEFRLLSLCAVDDDLLAVAGQWMDERRALGGMDAAEEHVLGLELESIRTAVRHKEAFRLEGGVLYVHGTPAAMTLASRISDTVLDVHFEKCLASAADDGGYAAVNWCFASACGGFSLLNREEDMGVEGLRKSKLSYHPDVLLDKYFSR